MRVGLPQHAAYDLLHAHLGRLVCNGRQDVGEGAVPSLGERLHGDDVADGAGARHQVGVAELVLAAHADGYLLGGNARVHKLLFQLLVGLGVLGTLRLGLQQRDRADVPAALGLGVGGHHLELMLQQDGVLHDLALAASAVDDHGQLDHLLVLELSGRHAGYHVRALARRGRELQHESRVQVAQHLHREAALGVVRLVHHDDGVRPREGRNQRRIVGALDVVRLPGAALVVGQLHERRVLGEGAPPVLVLEGVVGQHEHGELVLHRRAREPAPAQAVLLVKHLHPVGEVAVERHAQRVRRVAQLPQRLLQYLLARHEPHHHVGGALGKLFADNVDGVGGDERLAAAGGHLHANLGGAVQVVGVAGDAVRAGH